MRRAAELVSCGGGKERVEPGRESGVAAGLPYLYVTAHGLFPETGSGSDE